jgi:hypothetical protein
MSRLGYRERILLPSGNFFRFKITSADIDEESKFGAQLAVEVKTLGSSKYGGHVFTDWSKLATDEDTGELFVVEGGKAEEIFRATGQDPTQPDIGALVGKVIMARVGLSENGKRNRLEFGSIGSVLEDEEDYRSELSQAHAKMREVNNTLVPPRNDDGGHVDGEDEPEPTE